MITLEIKLDDESLAFLLNFSRTHKIPIQEIIASFLKTGMAIIPAFAKKEELIIS
jgi:hypothetical protein